MRSKNELEIVFIGIVILVFLVFIGFIISISFLYSKRQHGFARELETIRINHEKETFKAQLEIQEETFQYISREIHDNVGQFLSLAKLYLNTLNFDDKEKIVDRVNYSSDLLTRALEDLRDLSRSLNSEIIRNGGLGRAIEQQVSQLEKTGRYHVIFESQGDEHYLTEQKEIILFRILQEAVNNIVKHSTANEIIIFLCCDASSIKLRIQDNGKGFDPDFMEKSKRRIAGGINNMKKRAMLIDAIFDIVSKPGEGTKITVTTPI